MEESAVRHEDVTVGLNFLFKGFCLVKFRSDPVDASAVFFSQDPKCFAVIGIFFIDFSLQFVGAFF